MTIEQIAALIRDKGYTFQVVIPGTSYTHGKTTQEMATADAESLEAYLRRIASVNKAAHLLIKLFSKNGSSFKPRGEHLIFLAQSQPVATGEINATPVATPATNVAATGLGFVPTQPKTMDTKDYIDYRVLQTEHSYVKGLYEESKAKIQQLEKKVEDLQMENKDLIRTTNVQDDKHALAMERLRLQSDMENKQSLSGLVGELTKDPELLKMAIGFFKPDHPMFKPVPQALEGTPAEIKYSDDPQVNEVLKDLPLKLSQKDGETIADVYLLFQEFTSKPEALRSAVELFLPDYHKQKNS